MESKRIKNCFTLKKYMVMQTSLHQYPIFKDTDNSLALTLSTAKKVQFRWSFVDPFKKNALKEINDAINKFKLLGTIDY